MGGRTLDIFTQCKFDKGIPILKFQGSIGNAGYIVRQIQQRRARACGNRFEYDIQLASLRGLQGRWAIIRGQKISAVGATRIRALKIYCSARRVRYINRDLAFFADQRSRQSNITVWPNGEAEGGTTTPEPVRLTLRGLPPALPVMVIVPVPAPAAVGLNRL